MLGGEQPQEVLGKQQDVLAALAQRGQADLEAAQPIVQVLPEAARGHGLDQIHLGGGHHPHVDGDLVAAADPDEGLLLQRPQDLHLHAERQVVDVVEQQRAAAGALEGPEALTGGSGERALLVAEQLALGELARDGATGHGHERAVGRSVRAGAASAPPSPCRCRSRR